MSDLKFIPFTNDFMFSLVMRDEEICLDLLKIIIPEEDFTQIRLEKPFSENNETVFTQAVLEFVEEARGVRFDAYIKSKNVWVEIEMQNYSGDNIAKRSRYYQANMDMDALQRGKPYSKLPTTYVVFICTYDYMGQDEPVYFFQNYDNKNRLPLNDRAYKIILNTKCSREKVPERLRAFFDYINDPKTVSKDGFIERLEDRVRKYNTDEWRRNLMTLEELMERNHKIGYEKGHAEGHAEGKLEIAKSMVAKGFGFDVIEELTGISEAELRKMQVQTTL